MARKRTRAEVQLESEGTQRTEAADNIQRTEAADDIQQQAGSSEVTPNAGKGKKRGKTTLQVIPTGESQRQTIEWNEKGQPVGAQSVKFSSAVGCMVRETVPINGEDWRKVEDKPKNQVWGLLLQQYKVDVIHKPYIFQQMGRLWRAYKSELTSSVMTVLDSRHNRTETARKIGLIKPVDVPQIEWDEFVAERSSSGWREKSEKMKAIRAKQLLPHTLSRKGYAREDHEHKLKTGQKRCRTRSFLKGHENSKNKYVQEKCAEMEAKLAEQPPSEGHVPIKQDILHQVLGPERNGRVRGMGAGVTPSRVDGQLQNYATLQALQDKLDANEERTNATEERTKRLEEIVLQLAGRTLTASGGNGLVGSDAGSMHTSSPANGQSVQGSSLGLNQPCNILSWLATGEVVAKGRVSAVDPLTTVHGYMLGPDCYRVEIEEAVNPRANFFRYQPEFSVMEDAVGSTVAWPIKYIGPRT